MKRRGRGKRVLSFPLSTRSVDFDKIASGRLYSTLWPQFSRESECSLEDSLLHAKQRVRDKLKPSYRTTALTGIGLDLRSIRVHLNQWDVVRDWHIRRLKKEKKCKELANYVKV